MYGEPCQAVVNGTAHFAKLRSRVSVDAHHIKAGTLADAAYGFRYYKGSDFAAVLRITGGIGAIYRIPMGCKCFFAAHVHISALSLLLQLDALGAFDDVILTASNRMRLDSGPWIAVNSPRIGTARIPQISPCGVCFDSQSRSLSSGHLSRPL
jgi:hypothetical protein